MHPERRQVSDAEPMNVELDAAAWERALEDAAAGRDWAGGVVMCERTVQRAAAAPRTLLSGSRVCSI
jgi:hypothetical protein